ncbi:MAG: hypothetical protein R2847_08260 [Bacteroidia bacterium]
MRQKFLTNYYQKLETSAQSEHWAEAKLQAHGKWMMHSLKKLIGAKLKDINNAFNKYTAAKELPQKRWKNQR